MLNNRLSDWWQRISSDGGGCRSRWNAGCGDRLCCGGRRCRCRSRVSNSPVDFIGGTIARYVPCYATLVADFSSRVERATIGRSAVTRNMTLGLLTMSLGIQEEIISYQLSTCIALHGLSLAVASIMIGSATFVAGGCTIGPSKSTSEASSISTPTATTTTTHGWCRARSRTVTSKVTRLTTGIATTSRSTAAEP